MRFCLVAGEESMDKRFKKVIRPEHLYGRVSKKCRKWFKDNDIIVGIVLEDFYNKNKKG